MNKSDFQIIAFDQYNEKINPFNQLKEIWDKKMQMEFDYLSIIVINSLNSTDIKEYKYKFFFFNIYFWYDFSTCFNEIDDLIEPKELVFTDEEIDDKLEYIRRNIEYLIILKDI